MMAPIAFPKSLLVLRLRGYAGDAVGPYLYERRDREPIIRAAAPAAAIWLRLDYLMCIRIYILPRRQVCLYI